MGAEFEGPDGATAEHFEGALEDHVRVFGGMGREGEVEVEMEAAEAQSLSEWNLPGRTCLASAMRTDSAVTRMVLMLFNGARSSLGSRLGLISSACNEGCELAASGSAGDEESETSSSRGVRMSSQ